MGVWRSFAIGENKLIIIIIIYDLYRAYTGGSMRHYNDEKKQYIKLEVKY